MHCCLPKYQLQSAHCLENTFSAGFSNWKEGVVKFNKHEGSCCHKDAILSTVTLPAATDDVTELLFTQLSYSPHAMSLSQVI